MGRTKGTYTLTSNIEPKVGAPLDARTVVPLKTDLTANGTFDYPYIGLSVFVKEDNKRYTLIGSDPTVVANWREEGSGTSTSADHVTYDNTTSELESTNVQDAVDEVVDNLGTAAAKDFITSVTEDSDDLVTSGAVYTALENFPTEDTKVTQTATTTDANYEILFSATADNTTRTESAGKASTLRFNPSKGAIMEGNNTVATGSYSHAEGTQTSATGSNYGSHAEGWETLASGRYSHAEGRQTTASGNGSHVEGNRAIGSGVSSHAEGYATTASGTVSHTEGYNTCASGVGAHAEGGYTTASAGGGTFATGENSHAEGYHTIASGITSHAEGTGTYAVEITSHAEGYATTASGQYSHAEGDSTSASGEYSHTEGDSTTASGSSSHAEGSWTYATGSRSHTEGYGTTAFGSASHAEGSWTYATGSRSHTEGYYTCASGNSSHAEGTYTCASGAGSHAEGGYSTTANNGTFAIGENAHAEGYLTTASGKNSHAEGNRTKANSTDSHAEGSYTCTSGTSAHAEGYDTIASGKYSHAAGEGTCAAGQAQTVVGKFNIADTTSLFIVGNGTSSARSNALAVASDGTTTLGASGTITSGNSQAVTGGAVYTALGSKLDANLKGAANGVAELDANGLVPSSQLPSYVDDIIEVADYAHLPITGESGKIYVTLDTNLTYRWSGSEYVEVSKSLALGETPSTAYRGDRGRDAYNHATEDGKISSAISSGLYKVAGTAQGHIASLTAVTKADITALGIPGSDTNTTYTFSGGTNKITVTPSNASAQDVNITVNDSTKLPLAGGTLTGRVTTTKALNDIITGTGTAAQDRGSGDNRYVPAKWTFNTGLTATNGDIVVVKVPVDGHDYGTYMSIDNGTTYYAVNSINATRLTTQYPTGNYVALIFDSNATTSMYPLNGGTTRSNVTGAWRVFNNYDSGNNDTYNRNRYQAAIKADADGIAVNNIAVGNSSGIFSQLNKGLPFDIDQPILFVERAIAANGTDTKNYDITALAITTTQNITLTAYLPVYIKGTLSGKTFTPVSTTPLTQTIPTSADNYYYMLLGRAYSTTQIYLQEIHPIFAYTGGSFREYVGAAGFATNAGRDSDGNAINTTYVKKSGDIMTGQLFLKGSAASKPLKTRGIIGVTTDGTAEDALHIQYGNTTNDTINLGATSGASITNNGTQYSGNAATATNASKVNNHTVETDVPSGAVFTDTKVTQTATTTNANYEILFGETADNTTRTEGARKATTLRFNPSKGALMEGNSTNASGSYSHAEGGYTTASGEDSHAEGYYTYASGFHSHAEGWYTTAYGSDSHAEGWYTLASGRYSHAGGRETTASGHASFAEGSNTISSGLYSHAEGLNTCASGAGSHAEGGYGDEEEYSTLGTFAIGENSHAEGFLTTASGIYSHAAGYYTCASGYGAHAEGGYSTNTYIGKGTYATNDNAHAEGLNTTASGKYSHAEGSLTKATSWNAHSEGADTIASGICTHAEGAYSTASGDAAHAEGGYAASGPKGTLASGVNSHAEGFLTTATGDYSHAAGQGTCAAGIAQTVVGKFNMPDTTSLFIVGNGAKNYGGYRKNALCVNSDNTTTLGASGTIASGNSQAVTGGAVYDALQALPSNDTWRNIKVNGTEKLGTANTTGAVDFINGTNTTVSFDSSGNKIKIDTTDTNTTYTFAGGTNKFTVTPSGGSAQDVTITPSIANNITGSGTSGYLTKFNGTNTITNGPQLGSSTTTYLRNDGSWATPTDTNTHRPIQMNGTEILGNNTTALNLKAGSNVSLTNSSGTVTIAATDTNNRKAFYGTCDTAAGTAAKVVTLTDTTGWELKAGTVVGVKFTNTNTASNCTLNINNTGAKQVWYNTAAHTSTSSTIWGSAGSMRYYMYDGSTYWVWMGASLVWNDNTYDRNKFSGAIKCGATAIVAANIIVGKDGVYSHLKLGSAFDISYPILYASSAIAANATGTDNYDIRNFTITTTQSITLTAYLPVFIKGTLNGKIFTPVSTTPLTQTIPTSEDGYYYIYLGNATSTTAVYLQEIHPIFAYRYNQFAEITWNSQFTSFLKPVASNTTPSFSSWSIPSGCYQVWGQRWTDNRLKYTPSGGTETTVTDSGDWTMWLSGNGTSNVAEFNMRIDGTYYGKFNGNLSGNASSATKATQDGDGKTISSTYLKLSGGTMTGVLTAKSSVYEDSYSGALNMNNSNIYGLNSIYTADTSDTAAEGIHFYRDATHVDTLWICNGDLLFVPNRALGTSTSKADSQKVGRFTANPTSGQVVITDGTTGGMKSSGYTIAKSVPSDAKFTDHEYTAGTGLALNSGAFSTNVPRVTEDANNIPGVNKFVIKEYNPSSANLPDSSWYHILTNEGNDNKYATQFALGMTTKYPQAFYRKYSESIWSDWIRINRALLTKYKTGGITNGTWYRLFTLSYNQYNYAHIRLIVKSGYSNIHEVYLCIRFTPSGIDGNDTFIKDIPFKNNEKAIRMYQVDTNTIGLAVAASGVNSTLGFEILDMTSESNVLTVDSLVVDSSFVALDASPTAFGKHYYLTGSYSDLADKPSLNYLPLTGGSLTGGLEVKGVIAGDTGTTGHGLWSGGGYHSAYNNILLHGDKLTGTSGIAFISDKSDNGTITTINQPSDRAFIQYHAYGVTTATAENVTPSIATSGEKGRFVIGIGNDSDDQLWLQTPARTGLIHQVGATSYVIPDTNNTTGSVGSATQPVYVEGAAIKGCTYSLAKSVPSDADFGNTKNTAGSTDTSSKIFLIGATSQAANPQTYSDNEVYATSGVLTTKSVQVGGTAATMQYNSTTKSIDFVFA